MICLTIDSNKAITNPVKKLSDSSLFSNEDSGDYGFETNKKLKKFNNKCMDPRVATHFKEGYQHYNNRPFYTTILPMEEDGKCYIGFREVDLDNNKLLDAYQATLSVDNDFNVTNVTDIQRYNNPSDMYRLYK